MHAPLLEEGSRRISEYERTGEARRVDCHLPSICSLCVPKYVVLTFSRCYVHVFRRQKLLLAGLCHVHLFSDHSKLTLTHSIGLEDLKILVIVEG